MYALLGAAAILLTGYQIFQYLSQCCMYALLGAAAILLTGYQIFQYLSQCCMYALFYYYYIYFTLNSGLNKFFFLNGIDSQ